MSGTQLHAHSRLRELAFWMITAIGIYFLMSLFTYSSQDPGWSYIGQRSTPENLGGVTGAWLSSVFLGVFGFLAYLFPIMIIWSAWLIFKERNADDSINYWLVGLRWSGFLLTVAAGSSLAAMHIKAIGNHFPEGAGGILGKALQSVLIDAFSAAGSSLLLLAIFLGSWTLFTGISWFTVMDKIGEWVLWLADKSQVLLNRFDEYRDARMARKQRSETVRQSVEKKKKRKPPKIEPKSVKVEQSIRVEKEKQVPLFEPEPNAELPPLSLLDPPSGTTIEHSEESLKAMSQLLELKLADFDITAQVESVSPGPVVTLYELQLAPGTKASKVSGIANDLARALSTISVRVVEAIPGKPVIGIEIPNEIRETVFLSEVLRSHEYDKSRSPLTIALGKDIGGQPVITNLEKMPHGLIAGTTGSGKSVSINTIILSLLFKSRPDEVRLIMVDPKVVELSVYQDIPHLLTPVVTDMKEAVNALRWCVMEMERRYKLMGALGVRNISGFNKKIEEAKNKGEPIKDPFFKPDPLLYGEGDELPEAPDLQPIPYIVVIVDEFADMMATVGKKVEELIARLAAKARAARIHLLLATQRPDTNVITGLIKSNVPTRLAFQVSGKTNSRIILDQMGAEQLLGKGDSLYLENGKNTLRRVHGAFVSDDEVHRVVEALKKMGTPNYIEEIVQEPSEAIPGLSPEASGADTEDADPLFDEAVRIVTETRRASISGVQRRLKIGYNRAARMIEEMERIGIVTPPETNGNREVLAPPPPEN
ncbi:MAG: DNA translocase FtsK 4TM domain-containing protein [Gammaproteobacteria bacterium]